MLFKYFFPIKILTTPREGSFMTPSTANWFSLITSPQTDLDLFTISQIIINMTIVIEVLIRNNLYIRRNQFDLLNQPRYELLDL